MVAGGLAAAGYESQLPIRVFASLGQEVAVRILLVAAAAGMQGFAAPVLLFCCPQPACIKAAKASVCTSRLAGASRRRQHGGGGGAVVAARQ